MERTKVPPGEMHKMLCAGVNAHQATPLVTANP
mgnify:CR=1 FL=1